MGEHSIIISYDNPASFIVGTACLLPSATAASESIHLLMYHSSAPKTRTSPKLEQWSSGVQNVFQQYTFFTCVFIIPCDISRVVDYRARVIRGYRSSANNLQTGVRLCTPIESTSRTSALRPRSHNVIIQHLTFSDFHLRYGFLSPRERCTVSWKTR